MSIFDVPTSTVNTTPTKYIPQIETPLMRLQRFEADRETKTTDYIYLKFRGLYFSTESKNILKVSEIRHMLAIKKGRPLSVQELIDSTNDGTIPQYIDTCYSPTNQDGYYNTFNHKSILKPSKIPKLHNGIKLLIENITHGDQKGIDWLHKAILYKYTHLDDVEIPCIVFYGKGGSGKSTFTTLLSSIFGEENLEGNISKQKLEGQFDIVKGNKLIYEFAEVTTNNAQIDKGILNKLKTLIFAPKIRVNKKGKQDYETSNYAWFIINSNSSRPILLDSGDTGNRRFSFFKSEKELTKEEADIIYSAFDSENPNFDPNAVADYISWLYVTYPEVLTMRKIECLANEDKALVTQNSESKLDEFIRFLKEDYPSKRIWVGDIETAIYAYQLHYGNCDIHSLKSLFENYSPFTKKRGLVEGKGNVWYYDIK